MTDFVPLGEVALVRNGFAFSSSDFHAEGVPVIRMSDLNEAGVDIENAAKVDLRFLDELPEFQIRYGDLIIGMSGSVGKFAEYRADTIALQNQRIGVFEITEKEKLDKQYLKFFARTLEQKLLKMGKGVAVKNVSSKDIESFRIPLPSLPEQQRIAALLDRADRLRRTRRYAQQLSDSFLQAVFVEMFGDPVKNPMGWDIVEMGSQIDSIRYGTGSPPKYYESGIPFIRATNIKNGTIQAEGMAFISQEDANGISKCKVSVGNLLIVRSGVNTGGAAVVPQGYDGAFAAYDLIVEVGFPKNICYNAIINSRYGKSIIEPITRRAGQPHLNAEQVQELRFQLPPLLLQQKFARIVQQFERLRAQQREHERQAEHLFQTLLQRAFAAQT